MDEINAEILDHILEYESVSSDEEDYDEIEPIPEPPILFAANNGKKR